MADGLNSVSCLALRGIGKELKPCAAPWTLAALWE